MSFQAEYAGTNAQHASAECRQSVPEGLHARSSQDSMPGQMVADGQASNDAPQVVGGLHKAFPCRVQRSQRSFSRAFASVRTSKPRGRSKAI